MTLAYIGVGSNVGDSRRIVDEAAIRLAAFARDGRVRAAGHYLTPPWGRSDQPDFINTVVEIDTDLAAADLLAVLLKVEQAAGRVRDGGRWGPRALDLDVLLYGDCVLSEPGLVVPHPHLAERAFVLLPLAELAADRQVPGLGRVADLLARVDTTGCRRLDNVP
ncbi:2-amino-4-hydroxy-6-hydroxymethyldihydropteridine diphosphokinase [Tahibacter amnicola]|uniref:2-amino-4-hydroxy-6-hydroxymethyldihydropteridine pyrophosphokinase n=1 Tax=Tahibacter amnicola TaxID=2976241 RepID=A0ABY6BGB8_9GAMM|nr:2-amino-4-hydroxy-6-hydroxymethyldihydropteridine diphosphokinase [Tahibacter amnicola]UXI66912.1 2-amino-4-hydroxy-6-hydroxymethyldihydropteridine diphosphokinase [Tahibacter amnicola]